MNETPEQLSLKQLHENRRTAGTYVGGDASYLIGKHYVLWHGGSLNLNELSLIPISKITETSEPLSQKDAVYKHIKTQAPPVDVTPNYNGTYRLFNGHRRLASAKARGDKTIFAEIHHGDYEKYMAKRGGRI